MSHAMTEEEGLDKIWRMADDISICMMISRDGDRMRSRPMRALPRRDKGALHFFIDVRNHADDEFRADPQVCLTFAEPKDHDYASISGRAEVVDDRALAKEMWTKETEAWFPDGPDSPNLRMIRVWPEFGEVWVGPSSSLVAQIKMAAARMTGERPNMGDDKKVSFV